MKQGGPALLFENPKGSDVPLLINAFASMRRMELALGVRSTLTRSRLRIAGFLEMQKPEGLLDKLKMLPKLGELSSMFPEASRGRPVQRSYPAQRFLSRLLSDPALLAWGRRPLYHFADGVFQ